MVLTLQKRRCIRPECRRLFKPNLKDQVVCGTDCAIKYGPKLAKMKRKEKAKSRNQLLDNLQRIFNRYIRLRDQHLPCISCGKMNQKDGHWQAGHYLSRGAHPELRFNEDNCWRQCSKCNTHLSGNQQQYRLGLIERIGEERVKALEGPHEPAKWTRKEIEVMRKHYLSKIREIECYFPVDAGF